MVVVVEGSPGCLVFHRHLDCGRIGEVDVGRAIPVIIDEQDSAAHGFGNVFFLGRVNMPKMNAGLFCNVLKLRHGATLAGLRPEAGGGWRRDIVSSLPLSLIQKLRELQETEQRVANHSIHINRKTGSRGRDCAEAAA